LGSAGREPRTETARRGPGLDRSLSRFLRRALNLAFLGSPLLTLGMPFLTKEPSLIWCANLALLLGCYAYGLAAGDSDGEVDSFSGPLRWLDFGSGQERGVRGAARERLLARDEVANRKAAEPAAGVGSSNAADE